jgi:hypothetical protein
MGVRQLYRHDRILWERGKLIAMDQIRKLMTPDDTKGWKPAKPGGKQPPGKPEWLGAPPDSAAPTPAPAEPPAAPSSRDA